jgi:hypothetical protein
MPVAIVRTFRRMTMELIDTRALVTNEDCHFWWRANHLSAPLPLSGGWPGAATLMRAIDGAGWPFTTVWVARGDGALTGQVLGTAERCVLEVGDEAGMRTVYRKGVRNAFRWVEMPVGCQWWIPTVHTDELMSVAEAVALAELWLHGLPLPVQWSQRPVHSHTHRS